MFDTLDIRHSSDRPPAPTRAGMHASIDAMELETIACERMIGKLRARQIDLLRALDVSQVASADGSRSMQEWTAARLDIEADTARALLKAARQLADAPEIERALVSGDVSFDRALATAQLAATGADDETIGHSVGLDLAGVRRLGTRHRRMSKHDETQVFRDRFCATQATLDGTAGRFWGQLPGFELAILQDALDQRADMFRDLPGPSSAAAARRADALVSIAQDSLEHGTANVGTSSGDPLVSVFVDAGLADATCGEAGAEIAFGAKAGPSTLERILCSGAVQVIGVESGRPVMATNATRAIPPATRKYVAWRDGGCTIDGCESRYRLQPHHATPWSRGGTHEASNLTTLCWYHHHVFIHGEGRHLDPASPPSRRRFLRTRPRAP